MPKTYMAEKLAEGIGWVKDDFQGSVHTERGLYVERGARAWASFELGMDIRECSLCLTDDGRAGATPDGIFEDGSLFECKSPAINTWFRWELDGGGVPNCHLLQIHFQLWVTQAQRCHLMIFADHESLEHKLIEVPRDDFTEQLGEHVEQFCEDLAKQREALIEDPAYY